MWSLLASLFAGLVELAKYLARPKPEPAPKRPGSDPELDRTRESLEALRKRAVKRELPN